MKISIFPSSLAPIRNKIVLVFISLCVLNLFQIFLKKSMNFYYIGRGVRWPFKKFLQKISIQSWQIMCLSLHFQRAKTYYQQIVDSFEQNFSSGL